MVVPKTIDGWLELVKSFGLPVAILAATTWLLWESTSERDAFIRGQFLTLQTETVRAIEASTQAVGACTDALECNQRMMERLERKLEGK